MFCPRCGKQTDSKDAFCRSCGHALKPDASTQPGAFASKLGGAQPATLPQRKRIPSFSRLTVAASLFALLTVVGILYTRYGGPDPEKSPDSGKLRDVADQPAYQLPKEFFLDARAERDVEGEIYITGSTNLPDGLKIGVELGGGKRERDKDYSIYLNRGQFRSTGFTQGKRAYPAGKQQVHFLAYFNQYWQRPDLLALVGDGGKKLHGMLFPKTDPDVVDSDRILEYRLMLAFPPISPETKAIEMAKVAVLSIPGEQHPSSLSVEDIIELFMKVTPEMRRAKGWTASKGTDEHIYKVSFDFVDGSAGEKQALWEVDLSSDKVRYVNEAAKLFSWAR